MKLRIIPVSAYNGCLPITAYMVQKYVSGFFGGKWVNIKGFEDRRKAELLLKTLS